MDKLCYQPNHMWKGQKAIKKLKELSKEKPMQCQQWLSKQAFWQVHLPPPKCIDRPHYQVMIPNDMHPFDHCTCLQIHYMGISTSTSCLELMSLQDIKFLRPMRTKQAKDVADMIADVYNVGPLTYPKIFQSDNGSKFKAEVTKLLEKHEVRIQCAMTKYKHTHTAFVEALNKMLTERLFKLQDDQELNDPDKVSATWVRHLYGLVDELKDTQTQMTGMKPKDAIKLNQVLLVNQENYLPEDTLPEDGLYRYLLQPGEEHNDQRRKAMDRVWSKKTYRLREIIADHGNHVMYYLSDGPERAFMKEESMLIPEDTELPPDYVQKW